jgi:hypothetical protein
MRQGYWRYNGSSEKVITGIRKRTGWKAKNISSQIGSHQPAVSMTDLPQLIISNIYARLYIVCQLNSGKNNVHLAWHDLTRDILQALPSNQAP